MISEIYKNYILEMNLEELKSKQVCLFSTMKTTKFMTELRHGFKKTGYIRPNFEPFDLLYINMIVGGRSKRKSEVLGQLLVVYDIPDCIIKSIPEFIDRTNEEITFTELKHKKYAYYDYRNRSSSEMKINGRTFELWDVPILLKATTNYDKDFGDKYYGEDLVHIGNRYGDTSKFYIIGMIKYNNVY